MNTYLYAPKDDYKHRLDWRELYTDEQAGMCNRSVFRNRGLMAWLLWRSTGYQQFTGCCTFEQGHWACPSDMCLCHEAV